MTLASGWLRRVAVGMSVVSIAACSSLYADEPPITESAFPIRVTLLGTGTPVPNPRQFGQSILVEANNVKLLFDCGRGCAHRLWNLGPQYLRDTHHVFLTHLHSDHTVGIPDLYLTGWTMLRPEKLSIYGPEKAKDLMRHIRLAYDEDVVYRVDLQVSTLSRDLLEYSVTTVSDGDQFEFNGVRVTTIAVDHHVIKPAFGYRVDYGGHSVVISGDTAYSTNLIRYSKGADVMLHEVMSPALENFVRANFEKSMADDVVALHTLAPDVGRVFKESGVRLGVFTHLDNNPAAIPELIQQTRQTWQGPLEVGEDLMVIDIGEDIEVRRPPQPAAPARK
ncbi:MAG: MBL fold metallo-hydrolase [Woeseia sp.]|nr:MBL fold metallo-hydrolase [Woeseia sp.]NNE60941.1 MBL fold metallo-hydrolase [Woeseia sp.]